MKMYFVSKGVLVVRIVEDVVGFDIYDICVWV